MVPIYQWNIKQGTDEWLKLRLGIITASGISPLFVKQPDVFTLYSRGGETYIANKVQEAIFQELKYFKTDATQWGKDHEEEARIAYTQLTGNSVKEVGFVTLEEGIGCSPDGLVGDNSLIEIKCPFKTENHESYIKKGEAPKPYKYQMLHQLYCCQRETIDFFSYDPRATQTVFKRTYTVNDLLQDLGESREMYATRIKQTVWQIKIGIRATEMALEHTRDMVVTVDGNVNEVELWN